jgi:hypothetical protein
LLHWAGFLRPSRFYRVLCFAEKTGTGQTFAR